MYQQTTENNISFNEANSTMMNRSISSPKNSGGGGGDMFSSGDSFMSQKSSMAISNNTPHWNSWSIDTPPEERRNIERFLFLFLVV